MNLSRNCRRSADIISGPARVFLPLCLMEEYNMVIQAASADPELMEELEAAIEDDS